MSLAERLKEARTRLGYNQGDFAKKLSVNQQEISRYERGIRTPSAPFLEKVYNQLGVNINWLLTGEGSILRDESTSAEIRQKSNESSEPSEAAENPEAMGMVMSQLDLIRSMLEEKGQLPKEESGHCPVCASYWKLNEKNQAKVIGYTECLLEEQFKTVDIEDDDSNAAQNAG